MNTMVAGPLQNWLLQNDGARDQVKKLYDGMSVMGFVRIIAMKSCRDAKAGQKIEHPELNGFGHMNAIKIKIGDDARNGRHGR